MHTSAVVRSLYVCRREGAASADPALLHPWSRQRVHHGLLTGSLTKRELIAHMKRVASTGTYSRALSPTWWAEVQLNGSLSVAVQNTDVGSLLRIYDRFIQGVFGLPDPSQILFLENVAGTMQVMYHE